MTKTRDDFSAKTKDILAKRAGMKCIGITTTYKAEKLGDASIVVRSFDEIDLGKIIQKERSNPYH